MAGYPSGWWSLGHQGCHVVLVPLQEGMVLCPHGARASGGAGLSWGSWLAWHLGQGLGQGLLAAGHGLGQLDEELALSPPTPWGASLGKSTRASPLLHHHWALSMLQLHLPWVVCDELFTWRAAQPTISCCY